MYVYKMEFSGNSNPNTLETDRPQRGRPAACVIAQQYSSAIHYCKKMARVSKLVFFIFLTIQKMLQPETAYTEDSLCKLT
jgi:hypothetical protein